MATFEIDVIALIFKVLLEMKDNLYLKMDNFIGSINNWTYFDGR